MRAHSRQRPGPYPALASRLESIETSAAPRHAQSSRARPKSSEPNSHGCQLRVRSLHGRIIQPEIPRCPPPLGGLLTESGGKFKETRVPVGWVGVRTCYDDLPRQRYPPLPRDPLRGLAVVAHVRVGRGHVPNVQRAHRGDGVPAPKGNITVMDELMKVPNEVVIESCLLSECSCTRPYRWSSRYQPLTRSCERRAGGTGHLSTATLPRSANTLCTCSWKSCSTSATVTTRYSSAHSDTKHSNSQLASSGGLHLD